MEAMETDSLLSAPAAGSEDFVKTFKRKSCKYENKCERFKVAKREYSKQYSHLYYTRLGLMKKMLKKRAEKMWGEAISFALACYDHVLFKLGEILSDACLEINVRSSNFFSLQKLSQRSHISRLFEKLLTSKFCGPISDYIIVLVYDVMVYYADEECEESLAELSSKNGEECY